MKEIKKMYESAGVDYEERYNSCTLNKEGECKLKCSCDICKYSEEKYIYPTFTAEKLIKLEMFLINKGDFDIKKGSVDITFESFTSCIAGLINNLWQDLTEEEKQQVKGILE